MTNIEELYFMIICDTSSSFLFEKNVNFDIYPTMLSTFVMNKEKQMKLEASGWKIGSVDEFLELSQEETEFIELKLSLSQNLKERRQAIRLTQKDLARMIHSSQSRVAKMEAGDPAVSIDLLVK